jgi:hypothetical protein
MKRINFGDKMTASMSSRRCQLPDDRIIKRKTEISKGVRQE